MNCTQKKKNLLQNTIQMGEDTAYKIVDIRTYDEGDFYLFKNLCKKAKNNVNIGYNVFVLLKEPGSNPKSEEWTFDTFYIDDITNQFEDLSKYTHAAAMWAEDLKDSTDAVTVINVSHNAEAAEQAAAEQAAAAPSINSQQQAHLKNLIGATIYDKLVAEGGIVPDGEGNVVEFRVVDKERRTTYLLEDERKQLTFDIERLKSLPKLTVINLSDTGVSGDIAHLKSLLNLTEIWLQTTGVSGDIENLKSLTNLTVIWLRSTGVTGDIAHLKSLPKLTMINLGDTGVSGDIENLKSLTKLTVIWLAVTGVEGDIENLKSLTKLTHIFLGSTGVTGDIAHLNSLLNLTVIYLSYTGVSGDIENLKSLTKLTTIWFSETYVTVDQKAFQRKFPSTKLVL